MMSFRVTSPLTIGRSGDTNMWRSPMVLNRRYPRLREAPSFTMYGDRCGRGGGTEGTTHVRRVHSVARKFGRRCGSEGARQEEGGGFIKACQESARSSEPEGGRTAGQQWRRQAGSPTQQSSCPGLAAVRAAHRPGTLDMERSKGKKRKATQAKQSRAKQCNATQKAVFACMKGRRSSSASNSEGGSAAMMLSWSSRTRICTQGA